MGLWRTASSHSAWAGIFGLILFTACAPDIDCPRPVADLSGVEPAVSQRCQEALLAVDARPSDAESWGRLGEIYDVHGFDQEAVQAYSCAQSLAPEVWRWPYLRGLALASREPTDAAAAFAAAAMLRPSDPRLRMHAGRTLLADDRPDEAAAAFEQAAQLAPDDVEPLLGQARALLELGQAEQAKTLLESGLARHGQEGALHLLLAQTYRELGRDAAADQAEWATAVALRPARPDGWPPRTDPVRQQAIQRHGVGAAHTLMQADGALQAGQPRRAAELVERVLLANPESAEALVLRSRLQRSGGRPDRALADLERATRLAPNKAVPWIELGRLHLDQGRLGAAIPALRRALSADPRQAEARRLLARLEQRRGRFEASALELDRAAFDRPGDALIALERARIQLELARPDQASRSLDICLRIEPAHAEARYLAGLSLHDLGDFSGAVGHLKSLVSDQPQNPSAAVALGSALWELGDHEQAIAIYRSGIAASPDDPQLKGRLGWALAVSPRAELRSGSEARRWADQACGAEPDASCLDSQAVAAAESGDFATAQQRADAALALVRRSLDASPITPRQRSALNRQQAGLERRLRDFRLGRPFRDAGGG